MDIRMMRDMVRDSYSGKRWKESVDKMSDKQVKAIYFRLLREGKL